jgi:hypothetical protein
MTKAGHKVSETKTEVTELVGLVKAYALQETVGPLKRIGRTIAFGSAAAVVFGIASVLTLVGVLRLLQTDTGHVFAGEWDWVPYLLTIGAGFLMLGAAAALVLRKRPEVR